MSLKTNKKNQHSWIHWDDSVTIGFFLHHDGFLTNVNFAYWVIYRGQVNLFLALNSHRLMTGRHEYKWCHRHHIIATLCWVNMCHTGWYGDFWRTDCFCRYREKVLFHMPLLQPVSSTHPVHFCHIISIFPFSHFPLWFHSSSQSLSSGVTTPGVR